MRWNPWRTPRLCSWARRSKHAKLKETKEAQSVTVEELGSALLTVQGPYGVLLRCIALVWVPRHGFLNGMRPYFLWAVG